MTTFVCVLAVSTALAAERPNSSVGASFTPGNEERIVLVGDALIEREQRYGYLETALLSRFPGSKLRFRNLGWNADTLEGLSRSYFDPPAKGTERLFEEIAKQKPTMLFVGYGMAESLMAPGGAADFHLRLGMFLDKAVGGTATSAYLIAPIQHEDLGPPFPDPTAHRRSLAAYTSAIGQLATERHYPFIDLFTRMSRVADHSSNAEPWTINGIHLSQVGYWRLALLMEEGLGLEQQPIVHESHDLKGSFNWRNSKPSNRRRELVKFDDGKEVYRLEFDQTDTRLPTPITGVPWSLRGNPQVNGLFLRVTDLPAGNYTLTIDEQKIATASAEEWGVGLTLENTPQHQQVEELRKEVVRKNRLFFERYRPQNITYLLGFRSHEQGQNAKEIEALDQLVLESEEKIFELQQPKTHHFVLTRD